PPDREGVQKCSGPPSHPCASTTGSRRIPAEARTATGGPPWLWPGAASTPAEAIRQGAMPSLALLSRHVIARHSNGSCAAARRLQHLVVGRRKERHGRQVRKASAAGLCPCGAPTLALRLLGRRLGAGITLAPGSGSSDCAHRRGRDG